MKKLKSLRKAKKLTQADMAEMLGTTRVSYLRWENGTHEPDLKTLATIADYFNVSIDYLIGRTEYPKIFINEYANESRLEAKGKELDISVYEEIRTMKMLVDRLSHYLESN